MRLAAAGVLGGHDKAILGKSADDLVGDVLRELMLKPMPPLTNLRGYLTTAVRNRGRDVIRRSRYEAPVDNEFDEMIGIDDIEAPIDGAELAREAVIVLDQLPERERYAIRERVMLCRPAKDVGAELGVAPQRVSQLVNAGVARLRGLPAFIELFSTDRPLSGPSTVTGPHPTGSPS
jgi:RNA polymerase sigma factor (sigma-70 family)